MKQQIRQLEQFDLTSFISDYWQKKPLLIRQALPDWDNPLSPDELAGLSLEEEIESRIVTHKGASDWQLEQGPFDESRFSSLGNSNWSLLVQGVDNHVASVATLLDYFAFIPSWQVDDVMVSFATQGGGVGPHFDRYDVFLVQGQGRREWKLGEACDDQTPVNNNDGLLLLDNFQCKTSYVLGPGDILYVPPYLSHCGTSLDNDCMTYSVGFRSPAMSELIDDFATFLQTQLTEDDLLRAPLSVQKNGSTGAINPATLDIFKSQMTDLFKDEGRLAEWLGCWATLPKQSVIESEVSLASEDEIHSICSQLMANDVPVIRSASARFHYIESKDNSTPLAFFANGRELEIGENFEGLIPSIKKICDSRSFSSNLLLPLMNNAELREVIADSFIAGSMYSDSVSL